MELKGAEATIRINDSVEKKRHSKRYRHKQLDQKIREKRTEKEARMMKQARKNGVNVPEIEQVGEETLEIERIDGDQLKDVLGERPGAMKQLGENTARLHEADIIHGDLTTRNAMIGEELYIIDFGLCFRSQRIEDRAVDIHLLKQVLESSHPEIAEKAWKNFLEGYQSYSKSGEVLERLEEVEKRGRYK